MFFIALMALIVLVMIPIVTFSLQCFLSLVPGRKSSFDKDKLPRLAVLIPSHNEEAIVRREESGSRERSSDCDR